MVIHKENTSKNEDINWSGFAFGLQMRLFSDYVSLKLLSHIEPMVSIPTRFVVMVEVVEKSLKLYLAMHEKLDNALSHYSVVYGHNIEKLRVQAEKFNTVFADEDVKQFARPFNDIHGAFYQKLRYGSQKSIKGFSTNLSQVMPIVEKIFYTCILHHEEIGKESINNSSLLFNMITCNQLDQSYNRELVLEAVRKNNPYYSEYVDYCNTLDQKYKKLMVQFEASKRIN